MATRIKVMTLAYHDFANQNRLTVVGIYTNERDLDAGIDRLHLLHGSEVFPEKRMTKDRMIDGTIYRMDFTLETMILDKFYDL